MNNSQILEELNNKILIDCDVIISLTKELYQGNNITTIFDKDISLLILEYYLIQIIMAYVNIRDSLHIDYKSYINDLIVTFLNIMYTNKKTIQIDYDTQKDYNIKIIAKEKNIFMDRLKYMSRDIRRIDTEKKIIGQGIYAQKDLLVYNKNTYDDNKKLMDDLMHYEQFMFETDIYDNIEQNNQTELPTVNEDETEFDDMNINDANIIEQEEYELVGNNEDYNDGNIDD
jgi:hypothetical protein